MREFRRDMCIANLSPMTIEKRVEIVERFRTFLVDRETELLEATPEQLRCFQATFEHRAPATVDIYTRHLRAFFGWAAERGFVEVDPSCSLITTRLPKRRPHPWTLDDVELIFARTGGMLRVAFILAGFAGLRRGEICRLRWPDLDLTSDMPSALIQGKGGKERVVPLMPPVVDELRRHGVRRSGFVVTEDGKQIDPDRLSRLCYSHFHELGLSTTLHAGRHFAATHMARLTRDPVLVQQILGHESLDTTMTYVQADMSDLQQRLGAFAGLADELRHGPRLRIVGGE